MWAPECDPLCVLVSRLLALVSPKPRSGYDPCSLARAVSVVTTGLCDRGFFFACPSSSSPLSAALGSSPLLGYPPVPRPWCFLRVAVVGVEPRGADRRSAVHWAVPFWGLPAAVHNAGEPSRGRAEHNRICGLPKLKLAECDSVHHVHLFSRQLRECGSAVHCVFCWGSLCWWRLSTHCFFRVRHASNLCARWLPVSCFPALPFPNAHYHFELGAFAPLLHTPRPDARVLW